MKTPISPKVVLLGLVISTFSITGCTKEKPKKTPPKNPPVKPQRPAREPSMKEKTQKEAKAFLDAYFTDLEKLEKQQTTAYWKAANSGKKEDFAAFEKADLALKTLRSSTDRFKTIKTLLGKKQHLDPLTVRALEVAHLSFKANQLPKEVLSQLVKASTEIERTFSTFRGKIGKKKFSNNKLLAMLSKSRNSRKRRRAWLALKQVGDAVGPKIIALAKLRNEAAKKLGYKNFWEMKIRLQEHDPKKILSLFEELAKLTEKPFKEMKVKLDRELARKFRTRPARLRPWHYDNPFFQAPPPSAKVDLDVFYKEKKKEEIVEIAKTFFSDIGLPVEDILKRSDLYEREGKNQHAFCIAIDREGDVRTLVNIKPTSKWMDTLLHELGHALYYKHMNFELPYNLRDAAHILTTEGVAMLFGALAKNPQWLIGYAKSNPKKVKKLDSAILEQRRREQLIFTRWTLVMLHFEKALYENPDADLNKLWWDMVEKYQGLTRPKGRNAADWASKPHFTIAPVYYHNYMMGELFAAQLRATLAKKANHEGPSSKLSFTNRKDFGEYLKDKVFKPGMRKPWPVFVKESTGAPLTAKFFAAELK